MRKTLTVKNYNMYMQCSKKYYFYLKFLLILFGFSCNNSISHAQNEAVKKPNILLIISDQLNWDYFSSMGNQYVNTPNIDKLIAKGIRFDKAYVSNPVCIPSRVSMFTGKRPTYFGFHVPKGIDYKGKNVIDFVENNQIANELKQVGYQTYYGGKDHFGWQDYAFTPQDLGFEVYADSKEYRGVDCVPKAIQTLKNHKSDHPEQPFFMVTSLMNPHDICYAHIKDNKFDLKKIYDRTNGGGWQDLLRESVLSNLRIPEGEKGAGGYEPIDYYLKNSPPLPDNYLPQSNEPSIISGNTEKEGMASSFGRFRGHYDDIDWRLHRYAYIKFVEEIDREIGELLEGLRENGLGDDTYIIFTSDHGESNASHQMAGKGLFYDEVCHVPFIVSHKSIDKGWVDRNNLISNGLDIIPTVFSLAGIKPQIEFEGRDLSPLFNNNKSILEREYIPVEFSTGMGLVSKDFYYGIYFNGDKNNEQLYDMRKKPLQMTNDALDPKYDQILKTFRKEFKILNEDLLRSYGNPEGFMKFLP